MKPLQTTTLVAQTIVSPLDVATYTALTDRELLAHVYLSGLAGNGNYRACLTKQRGGMGTVYQGATAAIPVASGATTAWLETLPLPVAADDVVTVWVQGLAGDVSVGVMTDVFELSHLSLDGLDAESLATDAVSEIAAASAGGLTAQETADAVHNLAPVGTPAAGSMGAELDAILNGLTGAGLLPLIYTVTVTGTEIPIEGVTVEVYTEEACTNCIRRGTTNSFGVVTFWFTTPGTYWLRLEKDNVTFDNPDTEVVSA